MDSNHHDPAPQRRDKAFQDAIQPPPVARLSTASRIGIGVVVVAGVFAFTQYFLEQRDALPFPPTGAIHWYVQPAQPPSARVRITAPASLGLHHVVRLDDWESTAPLALIPVRSGATASVAMPPGRYRITSVRGKVWLGPERLFGIAGEARKNTDPLEISDAGGPAPEREIKLDLIAR